MTELPPPSADEVPAEVPSPRRVRSVPVWLIIVLAAVAGLWWWNSSRDGSGASGGGSLVRSGLQEAADYCKVPSSVGFDGGSLTLDTKGTEDASGRSVNDVACVLVQLGAPSSVGFRMDATRALDGMQTASWGSYSATWTFHPDSGLTVIVEEDGP